MGENIGHSQNHNSKLNCSFGEKFFTFLFLLWMNRKYFNLFNKYLKSNFIGKSLTVEDQESINSLLRLIYQNIRVTESHKFVENETNNLKIAVDELKIADSFKSRILVGNSFIELTNTNVHKKLNLLHEESRKEVTSLYAKLLVIEQKIDLIKSLLQHKFGSTANILINR